MELKQKMPSTNAGGLILLIVPYGIETTQNILAFLSNHRF